MNKFKIIERNDGMCMIKYKACFFFWFTLEDYRYGGFGTTKWFTNKKEAEDWIHLHEKQQNGKKIKQVHTYEVLK